MHASVSWFTDYDLYLLREGTHFRSYERFGAHLGEANGTKGAHFAVWAPNARFVSVFGDFNGWDRTAHRLTSLGDSGIWSGFVPAAKQGDCYKFFIESNENSYFVEKADPYAFCAEVRPRTASVIWDLDTYKWNDAQWLEQRARRDPLHEPMCIYEVHLGSWRRCPEEGGRWLTYRELAAQLPEYLREMGFTHVQFLPLLEHPFDGSWGYQTVGYFAPTSRFGTPDDFMYLVDTLHQHEIGVILDWTPAHFPNDNHGLSFFDGTHLYEHADPKQGRHPDWGTLIFNFGRLEVANFLLSSACFWFHRYHIDGFRVDAVASMLYLDYSRGAGEWISNKFGGRENLDAIHFLRRFNELVYSRFPGAITIAEESTAWPMVSRPTFSGGLGFGFKWNMGWMNDVLNYMQREPIHRSHHQNELSFSLLYAYHENFILPLSHDEVVHGKKALLSKMPGDMWQQFANLRLLYGFMYAHPGKKLLFMSSEFGPWTEWNHDASIDWHLLEYPSHQGISHWVQDLNFLLKTERALYELDAEPEGFRWIDCSDYKQSVFAFLRNSRNYDQHILVVCNFTPVVRTDYLVGAPRGGSWRELLNSDADVYGGSGIGNLGHVVAEHHPFHGHEYSLRLTLPPLGVVFMKPE